MNTPPLGPPSALEDESQHCRDPVPTQDGEQCCARMFDLMIQGFARVEIMRDEQGHPCDFRVLEVNEAFGRLTGCYPAQANGRTARELLPDLEPHWLEAFAHMASTGEPARIENHAEGLGKWFEVIAHRTAPEQFALLFIDVTERKRAEDTAVAQFQLAEAVFTNSIGPLVVLDRDYNFLRVNETYARACRREISDFVGRNHFEMYPSDAKLIFDEVVRTKQPAKTFVQAFVFPDQPERGVTYWDWTLVPVLDRAGEVEYLVFSLLDVTEREVAMDELRQSKARYRRQATELELIYRTIPIGLCVLDTELRYVHINARLAELNGIPAEAHLGKTVRELLPQVADRIEPLLRRVLETGLPVLDFEASVADPSGVTRQWVSQYWPLKSSDGTVFGINAVVQDVSEHRRLEEARRREQEFRSLAENSMDVIARFDKDLRRIYVNPAIESILGRTRAELLGKTHREIGLPEALAETLDRPLNEVFATGEPRSVEFVVPTPSGDRYLDARLVPEFGLDGEINTVLTITRDLTQRKQAEDALYRREQEFAALAERSPDIIARVDRSLRLLYINPAVERITGRPREWFLGKTPAELELPQEEAILRERALRQVFDSGREQIVEHKNPSPAGERYFQTRLVPEFGPDGSVESVLMVERDIDDLKQAQQALEALTLLDPLTGIANRRFMERFVGREWLREARKQLPIAAIMIDIDHFKAYNDHYGHAQGDECLRQVATILREALHRPADILVRYGGEEFIVLLPESNLAAAQEIAERLRQAVQARKLFHLYSPIASEVTISLGVAAMNAHEGEFGDLLAAADAALYQAKEKGRNRVETSL